MPNVHICHMNDATAFDRFREVFQHERPDLRFARFETSGAETILRPDFNGMKVYWLYAGEGEVYLREGFRTKEGDGQPLPAEYIPDAIDPQFAETLTFLAQSLSQLAAGSRPPVEAILSRRRNGAYIGDCANDLWKLEHAPRPWSRDPEVVAAVQSLFCRYRDCGYSTKRVGSFECIMQGDQLIVAGTEELRVRGRFSCLTLEECNRHTSHIPAVMRLRYLRDSSGGCNFDFDPFRRLPLTWYMNLPGETGDGINFVNAHFVNIAKETSPTHFHPPRAVGGGDPQNECYLVFDPRVYQLNTYGRQAALLVFPDLRDLRRYETHRLSPSDFVYIPAGTGHRGLDVFANVITIPGFKPHNEYYIDKDIAESGSNAPFNKSLTALKNYERIDTLI